MEHYAGIDVSLERSRVCIVDGTGRIVAEVKVASEPEALTGWLRAQLFTLSRIGLEAGPFSQWLFAGLEADGLAAELLETRHVRTAFKTMPVKTDKKDARGIAQLMRLGWFKPVHCKSLAAQEARALLTARKLLQTKRHDVEMSVRGVLRGFGLKVGPTTPRTFEARVHELVDGHPTLVMVAEALLAARAELQRQFKDRGDRPCRRPGTSARDRARRRQSRGVDLHHRDRRSGSVPVVAPGRRLLRPDAEPLPVRRDRHHGTDLEDRRSRRPNRLV
jgi:transposase